jgi:hypothetical protein
MGERGEVFFRLNRPQFCGGVAWEGISLEECRLGNVLPSKDQKARTHMAQSIGKSKKEAASNKALALPGSFAGLFSLVLSLACAVGYGVTQMPSREGYAGQVERQWRDVGLDLIGPNRTLMVSGDIKGQTVTDPGYQLTARGIYLSRDVKIYQWRESCTAQGCKVEAAWVSRWIDASKFKTQGYVNPAPTVAPQQMSSMILASRAMVGKGAITARAASKLGALAKPYKMSPEDVEIPGWIKIADGYKNFEGEPKVGSVKASFKVISNGLEITVAGYPDGRGDIDLAKGSTDLLVKEGVQDAPQLLGLAWWEMPRFGWTLLALSSVLFAAGSYGLWTAREIERQIVEERRKRQADRRQSDALEKGGADRRDRQRRAAPTSGSGSTKTTGSKKPEESSAVKKK